MKTASDGLACLLRQAKATLARTLGSSLARESHLRKIVHEAAMLDCSLPPPVLTGRLQAILRARTGNADPYGAEKERFTKLALDLLPSLEQEAVGASDPFVYSPRLAIAGNVIDIGARSELTGLPLHANV